MQSPYTLNHVHSVPHVGQVVLKAVGLSSCSLSLFTAEAPLRPFLPSPSPSASLDLPASCQITNHCALLCTLREANTIDCWPARPPASGLSGSVMHGGDDDGKVQLCADRTAERGGLKAPAAEFRTNSNSQIKTQSEPVLGCEDMKQGFIRSRPCYCR